MRGTGYAGTAARLLAVIAAGALSACGAINDGLVEGTSRFVSEAYDFEVSLSDSLDREGWFIVHERDAAITHRYTPPDSSEWTPVAAVIPPSVSFPALAPFNVDVFALRQASMTAAGIAGLRLAQVAQDSSLLSHRSLTVNGVDAEQVVYRQGNSVVYETFFTRSGLGYTINALGAPDTLAVVRTFTIDSRVYNEVVGSFRFTD